MVTANHPKALFSLGKVVSTPAAITSIFFNHSNPFELLARHVTGDFGDLCKEDVEANAWAIMNGERIVSSYTMLDEEVIFVITERDRSLTTLLLSSEY
jgi:hypothetical protein